MTVKNYYEPNSGLPTSLYIPCIYAITYTYVRILYTHILKIVEVYVQISGLEMKPNDEIIYLTLAGISISLISAGDREIQKSGSRLCDHVTPYGALMSHYPWRFVT